MNFPARLFPKGTHGVGGCACLCIQEHEPHALYPSPVFHLKNKNTAVTKHCHISYNTHLCTTKWVYLSSCQQQTSGGSYTSALLFKKKKEIKCGQIWRRQIISQASTPIKRAFHFHVMYCRCLRGLFLAVWEIPRIPAESGRCSRGTQVPPQSSAGLGWFSSHSWAL